jgi:homoserine dehydrogenase
MKEFRVGMLGFGNVMQAFVGHYLAIADRIKDFGFSLRFVAYCDTGQCVYDQKLDVQHALDMKKQHTVAAKTQAPLEQFAALIGSHCFDILIDALPSSKTDAGPSFPLLCEALKKKITVISVNKAPLVFGGGALFNLSRQFKTFLGISGTTAGCLPTSGIIMNELVGSEILSMRGILNGTSNYVLDRMMFDRLSCEQAAEKAVELGIAEPDYRFDLDGTDTCFKMIILGLLTTGTAVRPEDVVCSGIMDLDQKYVQRIASQDKVIRLIGTLTNTETVPDISVRPQVLDPGDPLFAVRGTGKGLTFQTIYMGDLTVIGGSSGRTNIAATIMKDIINACKAS